MANGTATSGHDPREPGSGPAAAPWDSSLATFAFRASTAAILVVALAEWVLRTYAATRAPGLMAMDYTFYVDRARSWLSGDGFYLPWQLTGAPYVVEQGAVTYPPTMLVLLTPFALGVPMIVWWVIPLSVLAWSVWHLKPPMWSWPVLALVLVYPRTWFMVCLGNPSIWVYAAFALGLSWGWPAALAVLKPTLGPFSLIGIRERTWWTALGVLALVSVPFGLMWLDYANAMLHASSDRGADYLLGEWPILLALLVARRRRRPAAIAAIMGMRSSGRSRTE